MHALMLLIANALEKGTYSTPDSPDNETGMRECMTTLFVFLVLSLAGTDITGADRFSGAGTTEDQVALFLASLQNVLETGNHEALADLVSFPLRFNLPEGRTTVNSRPEFMILHEALFPPDVRALILTQTIDSLFVNSRGVMIGLGQVWFGPTDVDGEKCLRIITVNRIQQ